MAGFLTSAGTALGGFNQGYDNAQQAALKRILGQLALQQEQRKIQGARLGGMGLMQGVPGLSPAGMGGMPGGAAMPQPQPPPPIPSAPTLTAEPDAGGTFKVPGAGAPGSADFIKSEQDQYGPENVTPLDDLATTSPAAPPPAAASGSPTPAASGAPDPSNYAWVSGLFKQLDPNAIAKRLSALDPTATPDVVMDATQQLMKLAESDRSGQQQAAIIARMMLGEQGLQKFMIAEQGRNERHGDTLDVRQSEGGLNRGSRESVAAAGRSSRESIADANRTSREEVSSANRQAAAERQSRGIDATSERQIRQIEAAAERQGRALSAAEQRQIRQIEAAGTRQDKGIESRERIANDRFDLAKQRIEEIQARRGLYARSSDRTFRLNQNKALLTDIDKMLQPGGLNTPPEGAEKEALLTQRRQILDAIRRDAGLPPTPAAPGTATIPPQ